MVVGFAAGGTADSLARAVAEAMRPHGYNVVVDNRPGAAGRIGTETLMAAPTDGLTLMMAPSTNLTLFPHVYANLRYRLSDFALIASAAEVVFGLAVPISGPKTLGEFLDRARADPLMGYYGTPGAGSVMQLLGDLLGKRANVRLNSVPYKGGAAALNDVVGGVVPAAITAVPNLLQMHRSGKLRILAVTSNERLPALPEVPTFKAAGFPDLTSTEYMCIVAKRGIPSAAMTSLAAAVAAATGAPATQATMERIGFQTSAPTTSAALTQRLVSDSARWEAAVRETGFKPAE
jgi:tripartite-type tricarboxylate transporter receptor subunit TctC